MAYAIDQDLIDRYGEAELLQLTDRMGGGEMPDAAVLSLALADADAEIEGYLRGHVALPLTPVPAVVVRVACDIARFRLWGIKASAEVRNRYEDARSWLRDVAAGRVLLSVPTADRPAPGIAVLAPAEVFTSATLARMP